MSARRRRSALRYSFAPWITDETLYPVGRYRDGEVTLTYYKRREFPHSVYGSKFNTVFLNKQENGWRCFISHAQCFFIRDINGVPVKKIPFAASLEHLVPMKFHRFNGNSLAHRLRNQTVAARIVNKNIGHIPLALKILHRHVLRGVEYDREHPTLETYYTIKASIIDTEEQLFCRGKFPWQPWTYDERDRVIADSFMTMMEKVDAEFLAINNYADRQAFVDNFEWRW